MPSRTERTSGWGRGATAAVVVAIAAAAVGPAFAKTKDTTQQPKSGKITYADRKAAADRAQAKGEVLPVFGLAAMAAPGAAPHYYGPYPNYANSPLRSVGPAGNPLQARAYPTDTAADVLVIDTKAVLPNGTLTAFETYVMPGSGPNAFHAYVLRPNPSSGPDAYDVVFDSGPLSVPDVAADQVQTFTLATPVPVQAGDVIAHYGPGIPLDIGSGTDTLLYPASPPPASGATIVAGSADYPFYPDATSPQPRAYSFQATVQVSKGIQKFVDALPGVPGVTTFGANDLGQYIPLAVADTTTYPGTDYYELAVVQYRERMHRDLPPTLVRGYVQLSTSVVPGAKFPLVNVDGSPVALPDGTQALAVDAPHSLGPMIVAQKNRPVRILFRNLLPSGVAGDLFLPVDTTVMGSGMGPDMGGMANPDPQNPMCGETPKPAGCFAENRATIHLHGGITPWISDGTPHQWITPANDATAYPKGVSVSNVPDMPDPGPGAQTFFYTNQQSARLLFYHDHSWGITRLNVYAGEVAPYLIGDSTEQAIAPLLPAEQIPLVVQDKTFVPSVDQLATQDPLWDVARWGGEGSLWLPHVYMPAQNPGDSSGVNQFGRWAYGPWFWPPTSQVQYGPMPNPYYDAACDPATSWCEPPEIPGVPYLSMGMESFHDTPVVNGTAYPTLAVEPKAYRLRILNGANDRFWNLQLYVADATGTEVALNAAEVEAALADPAGVFPTPDTALSPPGPSWIQIGTEGGFLPSPVVVPPQPITWVTDPTVFNAGNVDKHSLLLGPAERADVVVDFSQFAGKTLILYNDAPAAFPARDPRYDYYTGNADLTSTGGAPSTPAGYGPNTRTVMQIKVADATPAAPYDLAALQAAFRSRSLGGQGVFESSQNPIIVGQGAYNDAYGKSFRSTAPRDGFVRITDFSFTFDTLLGAALTIPLRPKAIQDEMGEAFEKEYGRMSGNLGLEAPGAQAGAQNLILYPYVNPASEIIDGIELPVGVLDVTPIASADDGTQVWKITHNGVDTHPIHFHLFDVQLVNRVGWDGIIRRPDANELGWKDTVRVSPLEDTIVALRPIVPKQPFGVPDSVRPLNPMMPLGDASGFNSVDANGNPITPAITNEVVNFGAEYVWHCHILSHEEMDMMRPISVLLDRQLAARPVVTYARSSGGVSLGWTDGTPVTQDVATWGSPAAEIGYRVERAPIANNGKVGAYASLGTALANATAFSDASAGGTTLYSYRVVAWNAAGESASMPVLAGPANVAPPAAPTALAATLQAGPQIGLAWTDAATNETGFVVERSTDGGATFVPLATPPARNNTGAVTYVDTTVVAGQSYLYRVKAVNGGGASAWATSGLVGVPAVPAAPSNLAATAVATSNNRAAVTLTWTDNAADETGYTVERATDAAFTAGVSTSTLAANATTATQTGLARGTTYYFRVRAFNLGGPSSWSSTATVKTP